MTLGVLITNYHAWHLTLATLEAVLSMHPDHSDLSEIIVIDDASDAPETWSGDSRVHIHRNAQNLGYVRSVNVGMALMNSEIVVLLDCDARPLTSFANVTRQYFDAESSLGVLGFTQTDESESLRPSGEPTPTLREFIIGPAFFSRLPSTLRQLLLPANRRLCIHSCCMAVRRSAFNEVGGFDEQFDFLDADMDFSWCLIERGWTTIVTSEVLCFHPGGGSPQKVGQRVLRHHQNRWRLLEKHGHLPWIRLAKILLLSRHFVETSILALLCLTPVRFRFREKLRIRFTLLAGVFTSYQSKS